MQETKVDDEEVKRFRAIPNHRMQDRSLLKRVVREILGLNGQNRKLRQQGIAVMAMQIVGSWSVCRLMVAIRENVMLRFQRPVRKTKSAAMLPRAWTIS